MGAQRYTVACRTMMTISRYGRFVEATRSPPDVYSATANAVSTRLIRSAVRNR